MTALVPFLLAGALGLGTGHSALGARVSSSQNPTPSAESPTSAGSEVIAEIRVHGNLLVSNDDVVKIAGIAVGQPFTPTTVDEVTARLRASKKFEHIEVLKRFASISDPTRIVVVVVVNEGAVRVDAPGDPSSPISVVKRTGLRNLMFMPILDGEDGYGLTYGVRFALVNLGGRKNRLSFPLSWGGFKQAGAEFDERVASGPISRYLFGADVQRQTNPAFVIDDDRQRVYGRVERAIGHFKAGGNLSWQHVSFASATNQLTTAGADVTFDTRLDPVLPRNAVYGVASWEHVNFDVGPPTQRLRLEGRGYLGLFGQNVLAVRVIREDADGSLPPYLKSLLGGWSTLRGFKAGAFVGDTMMSGSAELRIPLSSPLRIGKIGVSLFVDSGKAYDKGERFGDAPLHTGAGASFWLVVAMFHMDVSVAHGNNADTRVNFGIGVTF
jgi:outer membrane protein assembly factor BamA